MHIHGSRPCMPRTVAGGRTPASPRRRRHIPSYVRRITSVASAKNARDDSRLPTRSQMSCKEIPAGEGKRTFLQTVKAYPCVSGVGAHIAFERPAVIILYCDVRVGLGKGTG